MMICAEMRLHLGVAGKLACPQYYDPYTMVDNLSSVERSRLMARVKHEDTQPELIVRRILHRMGYRFRLHRRDLPGKPDIVLPKLKAAVFVNGCFWHGHKNCRLGRLPKSNVPFWQAKISANIKRDRTVATQLREHGWNVKVVWACQAANLGRLESMLQKFLRTQSGDMN